jgi:TRAP-type C4-dicarboxylate transport system substrate-binding protein
MPSRARTILAIALALIGATGTAAETRSLRVTLPKQVEASVRQMAAEFKEGLEKRSGGALTIDLGQQQVYRDDEIVSATSSGAIEIGGTTLNQFAYDVPLAGIFLQPFMFNFKALVRAAAKPGSEIRTLIDDEILYWTNARVLWWQPNGSNVIVARRIPEDAAAIANLAVGATDDQSKEFVRVCSGQPHLLPTEGLHGALKDATVQLALTDMPSVKAQSLWEVAEAIVDTRHAPSLFIVVINDRVWQGLTPEQQQAMMDVSRSLQERSWDRLLEVEAEAYSLARQKGMKIYDLMPADVEQWRACSSPLLEAYMERIGEAGQKLFAAYGKLRTDPCCRQAPQDAVSARQ